MNQARKTINITNAVQYQTGNPGTIQIIISTLKNPAKNLVTETFQIRTFTKEGFALDALTEKLTINFFCEYPCAQCNLIKTQCTECYAGDTFPIFFNYTCLAQCPSSYTNTSTLNCTECISPCKECIGDGETCTECIDGY